MIDESLLADPARCPACAALLPGATPGAGPGAAPTACPACGLPLAGPAASRLWQVSVEVTRLLAERARLIDQLRAEAARPRAAGAPVVPVASARHQAAVGAGAGPAAAPRQEWTPRRVQNLLLGLGVALLAVAAVIFVAVSWGRLGVGGRAAVMTGVTALAAAGARAADRRRLTATAEALSLLTVGLALLDCAGAWASDLAGLRSRPGEVVAALSTALVATLAAAGSTVLRTRALRLSAAGLGQLPVPLVALNLADSSDHPGALLATAAIAQAIAGAAAVQLWRGRPDTRDARVLVAVGAALAAVAGTGLSLGAAYLEDGSLVAGTALLLVLVLAIAVVGELLGGANAGILRGTASALLVAAAWAPLVARVPDRWVPPALALAAAVPLGLARLLPADRRRPAAVVTLAAALLPAVAAVPAVLLGVVGRLQCLGSAWQSAAGDARGRLVTVETSELDVGLETLVPALLVLLVAAGAVAAAHLVDRRLLRAGLLTAPLLGAAALLAVPALDGPYAAGIALDLFLGIVALSAAVELARRGRTAQSALASLTGSAVLAFGLAWALAVDIATLVSLPAASAGLAVVVAQGHGQPRLRAPRVLGAAAAVLLLVTEAAALTRHGGAGWPAVSALSLGLLAAVSAAAVALVVVRAPSGEPFWAGLHALATGVGAAALVADAAAVAWWRGADLAGIGLAATVVAAALVASSTAPIPPRVVDGEELRLVGVLVAVPALLASATDGDSLWLALLALGVAAATVAVRVDHRAGWVSGVLLTASSWVRLAIADVEAPEAYTVPPALALLAVGWRRRAVDPAYRSWPAYGPGLALALGPSLLRAVTDAGNLRPLLLGLAALAVLAVGVARRLQAPLLLGGGVLAVDAVVQLAPYLAVIYDVVPRWVTIGVVGLLLLGAGATYEQRVRDLRRVGDRVTRLS